MESTILKFVLKHSRYEQIKLVAVTLAAFPFLYLSLDLPKTIINEAIGGTDFPREFLWYEFDESGGGGVDQITFLLILCFTFLFLVLLNGGFKYCINVFKGIVGERMLRRLRYQLFDHVMRFPVPQFRKMSQGEIVSMITAETEPLGGYVGDSIALPAFQGGTLLTILVFMFIQDWLLGVAAVALYPVQGYLIPKFQRRVNQLKKERTIKVRKLSERIGEVVGGIQDVHTHDTSQYELAEYSERIGDIFEIRYNVYLLKFFIKFLNNFIAQITPFFFYSIGGYLVIKGDLSFGALVAILAAYKDLAAPWKELLNFYQIKEDARIKYELLYDTFQPSGMLAGELQLDEPEQRPSLLGELAFANVDIKEEEEGEDTFPGSLSFKISLPQRVAVIGAPGSGKDRMATILSAIKRPASGSVAINGVEITQAPESVTGRTIAYVGQEPSVRVGTLRDNLYYGLKHRPTRPADYDEAGTRERSRKLRESNLSGNSPFDINADWLDYEGAGVSDLDDLTGRAMTVLAVADMADDIYDLGLQGTFDPQARPELAAQLLEARNAMYDRLQSPDIAELVELFDRQAYNTNMTVAENLMFGTPLDPGFKVDLLAENPYVRKVLHETELMADFLLMGRNLAELMVDLFADIEPGSEMFEQFSFISADDLPEFRSVLARTDVPDLQSLSDADRRMLLSLPFRLIPARHRLGLIDEPMRERLLAARVAFAEGFGMGSPPVDFFERDRYNSAVSIQDNILFGRLAYGKARSASRVGELIREVVEMLDLRQAIMEVGLDFPVGIGGSRLTPAQRQKLSIARAVLKRPDVLIVDEATAMLDSAAQSRIMGSLQKEFAGRTLIWLVHHASLGKEFDQTLVMDGGRMVEQGRFEELDRPGTVLNQIVMAS